MVTCLLKTVFTLGELDVIGWPRPPTRKGPILSLGQEGKSRVEGMLFNCKASRDR